MTPWVGYCGGCMFYIVSLVAWQLDETPGPKQRQRGLLFPDPAGQNSFSASKPLSTSSFCPMDLFQCLKQIQSVPFLGLCLFCFPFTVLSSSLYPPAHQLIFTHFSDGSPQCLRVENPPEFQELQEM